LRVRSRKGVTWVEFERAPAWDEARETYGVMVVENSNVNIWVHLTIYADDASILKTKS
jgi:hypothetical protein